MNLINIKDTQVDLRLKLDDVLSVNNALNEVCNGLDLPDFGSQIGCKKDYALNFLGRFSSFYERTLNPNREDGYCINFSLQEIILIIQSFRAILDEIEPFEFETRLGVERDYISKLLEEFIYVYNETRDSIDKEGA